MNNSLMEKEEMIRRMKDPKFYLESFCKIKGKSRGMIPFEFNEAQKDCTNAFRRHNRIIILKARQMGFCLDKNTRVLSSDLRWIPISDINIGQSLVSVEENIPGGRGSGRKMNSSIVEAKRIVYEDSLKIMMDNGMELIATPEHRFLLKRRGGTEAIWKKVKDIKINDEIRYITKPWGDSEMEDMWFAGLLDGEGSLRVKKSGGVELSVCQTPGLVWDRLKRYVEDRGLYYREEWDNRRSGDSSKLGDKPVGKIVFNRMNEIFEIIGRTRPTRFLNKKWWEGKDLPGKRSGEAWSKIVSIENYGKREMIDLQTSTKTFIAEGFVSHNSTLMTGLFYHDTIMNPGTNTALIGYNSDMTAELLDKVKTFYKTTPKEIRPNIKYNSKFEISFPDIDSKIIVLPSTENVGRSYTLHNVLITELSTWSKAEEKMTALESSVPITGKIVVESTPRGAGNLYHRMWVSENDYVKKEYGWWWGYNKEEIETIRKRMNNPMKFAQEYGLEFLASGRSVFDQVSIKKQYVNVLKHDDTESSPVKIEDELRIYKDVEQDGIYIAGVDVSEGVEGGDYSVMVMWNRKTGEEVAFYRGLISPDRLADKLDKWGRKYNNALMVVEVNNHGLFTLMTLKKLLYPSLYFRVAKYETMGEKFTDRMGWRTNVVTRTLLIDELAQALRDGLVTIHSKEILDEMYTFVYDDNNDMVPQSGYHDDCIFAAGIGFQGFKVVYDKKLDQINYERELPSNFSY